MLNSLYVAALGMQAQKLQLDVVSNNLANANTPGFKRERVDFSSILDQQAASGLDSVGVLPADPVDAGTLGVVRRDLSQGQLRATESDLDISINGVGFIEIQLDDQRVGYVRGGSLIINSDGYLATNDGHLLKADVRIPAGATGLKIAKDGAVTARLGADASATELGRIPVVSFSNPESLSYLGTGVYTASEATADPLRGHAGEDGLGEVASGKLEISNVKLVDEMVSLMLAQRVYELNSRVIQTADEIMGLTNNLRRG